MSRREFVELLTDTLVGRVPGALVSEKADFYRRYITDRAKETGKTEADIIEELGPPELIARTIIDAYEAEYGVYSGEEESSYASFKDTKERRQDSDEETRGGRIFHLNMGENGCFLIGLVVIFIFLAVAMWLVRFITAYPLLIIAAVLAFYLWNAYKRRH